MKWHACMAAREPQLLRGPCASRSLMVLSLRSPKLAQPRIAWEFSDSLHASGRAGRSSSDLSCMAAPLSACAGRLQHHGAMLSFDGSSSSACA